MKAILVVDTTKCRGCPFCHESAYYSWCDAPRKERFWEMPLTSKDIEEERTVECPLRPLPTKKEHSEEDNPYSDNYEDEYEYQYREGYNTCLREITGETE